MTTLNLELAEDRSRSGQPQKLAPTPGTAAAPGGFRVVRSERRCNIAIDVPLATPGHEYYLDAAGLASLLRAYGSGAPAKAEPSRGARTALVRPAAPHAGAAGRLRFNRQSFFRGYAAAFSALTARQKAGLNALLTAAEADRALTDVRWLAYMLATVQHECAGTWRPIEEYGKGKGRPYGKHVVVTDPQGKKHDNVYYGRGYVQLTWKNNYQKLGKLLHNRLLYAPALALRPPVAYRIMSLGMRGGIFTGKKLGDYIRAGKTDYVNARRIINGLDRAQRIARNARALEKVLRRSRVPVAARRAARTSVALGARPRSSHAARAPLAELHDESAWLSTFDGQPRASWEALALNRQATSLRSADGFNIPAKHRPSLWQWKKADATTLKWRPQGITGSRAAGSPPRARWLAISWYGRAEKSNEHAGVRISFVDVEPGSPSFLEYRHVLLVQDARNIDRPELFALPKDARRYQQLGGFAPVPVHAGGIAWVGERLFVADTSLGLRVFDPTRIYAAHADPGQTRCGIQDGRAYAFDYGYVLPQVGYYHTPGTAPNSFVSVGSGAHGPCLWTGQYLKKDSKRTPTLFGWKLLPKGGIDTTRAAELFHPDDSGGRAYNVQGVYRAAGATWLTTTGRPRYHGSTARLVTQGPSGHGLRWRWPHGAEDLYLEADTHTLWCLTEFAASESGGERFVFGVSLPTYAPQLHPSA